MPTSEHPSNLVPPPTQPVVIDENHPAFGEDVPFWRPGVGDWLKHLGWRWVLLLPPIFVLAAIFGLPWYGWAPIVFAGGGKLLLLSIGLALTVAGAAFKSAVNQRKGPFCIHCGYDLTGLPDGHSCPECGRPFSFRLIEEYRRDPSWFIQRFKHGKARPISDVPFNAGPVRRPKSRDGT